MVHTYSMSTTMTNEVKYVEAVALSVEQMRCCVLSLSLRSVELRNCWQTCFAKQRSAR